MLSAVTLCRALFMPHFHSCFSVVYFCSWSLQRISKLIIYSYYKNVGFRLTAFWFGLISGFSGTSPIFSITGPFWNVIFTSLPIMGVALLDKDMAYQVSLV